MVARFESIDWLRIVIPYLSFPLSFVPVFLPKRRLRSTNEVRGRDIDGVRDIEGFFGFTVESSNTSHDLDYSKDSR